MSPFLRLLPCWRPSLAVTVLFLAACREAPGIRIGAAGNWREANGVMVKRGIDLATQEINALGGVGGRTLSVAAVDDSSDGSRAVQVASQFLADPEILAVVGHNESGPMIAAARVYDRGLPAVSSAASAPALSGISPWVFRVISSDSMNGRDMANYARRLGLRRAAVLYENNSYGRELANAFVRHFGGIVVSRDPIASDSTSDLEPNLTYARLRRPDVVFVAGTAALGTSVLREARRQGIQATFIGGDGWNGVVASGTLAEEVIVGAPFSAGEPRDEVRRFVQAFRRRFGVEPDANAALAYDATRLLAQAIDEAGTSRPAIREWLARRLRDTPFRGVTGSIQFESSGDVVGKGLVMSRVQGGTLHVDVGGRGS